MSGQGSILAAVLRVPLFAGLRPLQITEIARQAERARLRPGSVIAQAGVPTDCAHLIVSGSAERRLASSETAERVEAGSLVCELAMFVDYVPVSTVVAVERTHLLRITRAALQEQMLEDARLARHFESIFIERLKHAIAEAREIDRLLEARAAAAQAA